MEPDGQNLISVLHTLYTGDRDFKNDVMPTTTVVKWADGKTNLQNVEGEPLTCWLKEYSLGSLFRSGELENGLAEVASILDSGGEGAE